MDKIYFPIEKTVFLPREKAPIGKMERVTAKAMVDAIEPAKTGWLCYGKLMIDLEYTPMGTGKEKHPEQWKEISQQLLAMGKEAKELCTIAVDFIQELPDQDYTYGCEFDVDVQKKTWQQIASNALEIGVDIALSVKEQQKKAKGQKAALMAEDNCMILEQDSFSLEDKAADDSRTKKATATEPEELYYYAAEEGCEIVTPEKLEDTIVFCPAEEERPDTCGYPVDFTQKEICPTEDGAGSKGQHLYGKKEAKAVETKSDCPEEMVLEGDMAFTADCPTSQGQGSKERKEAEKKAAPAKKKEAELECCVVDSCEAASCSAETESQAVVAEQEAAPVAAMPKTQLAQEAEDSASVVAVEEAVCLNEDMILETEDVAGVAPAPVADEENVDCEVVPLPLPGKEKHRFWKGKKDKKDGLEKESSDNAALMNPFAPSSEKPAEQRKGYRLKFYVVQGGEDLAAIAEKHSVSPESILDANKNITEEDIRTGMVLSIPM